MKSAWVTAALVGVAGAACLGFMPGCGHDDGATPSDAGADASALASDLLDPHVCGTCHEVQFNQWAGSMHAYASQDPVFLAMNQRMQRENPSLGPFCVKCHAPMALLAGKTTDGLNLPELTADCANPTNPSGCGLLGVTCYFCHSIESVDTAHEFNAGVTLASDLVMRGEFSDPVPTPVHGAKYSPFHDRKQADSAALCGACHDIHSPVGGHIERTFEEWQASPFSGEADAGAGASAGEVLTCAGSGCHMVEDPSAYRAIVANQNVHAPDGGPLPFRQLSAHDFPAVDQAQKAQPPFPNGPQELAAIQQNLANALQGALCVTQAGGIQVILDTVNLGHNFPSGATQDRRLWAEVKAYDQAGNVLYQSGVVPDGMSPVDVKNDPDMWLMRDCMFDTDGGLVDMFWQGATYDPNELPPIPAFSPSQAAYASHKVRFFPRDGAPLMTDGGALEVPASVTLRLRLQPIGIDVLNDLVSSGDLDAGLIAALPPPIDVPLGSDATGTLTWTAGAAADSGVMPYSVSSQGIATCVGTRSVPAEQFAAPSHKNPQCSP